MADFTQPTETDAPLFVEVFTDKAEDVRLLKEYYHSLRKKEGPTARVSQ